MPADVATDEADEYLAHHDEFAVVALPHDNAPPVLRMGKAGTILAPDTDMPYAARCSLFHRSVNRSAAGSRVLVAA
jgi:hypothetical protein